MTASLLDGKNVASLIRKSIKDSVEIKVKQSERAPGLAVILVGSDPASTIYVANKKQACIDAGFQSFAYDLPASTTEEELLLLIDELNEKNHVDGILVQFPLPAHISKETVIERISPQKDVDGFHPYNIGRLAQGIPTLRPCTPYGIIMMLKHYQIELKGKHAVVVGASNIVGKPMAFEFLREKATTTVCHRATNDLESHVRDADILVVATGVHQAVDSAWLHDKQIIIDVGIHRGADGKLKGDVDFQAAQEKVAWITPVPGGVGPMTVTALLKNTLQASNLRNN